MKPSTTALLAILIGAGAAALSVQATAAAAAQPTGSREPELTLVTTELAESQ